MYTRLEKPLTQFLLGGRAFVLLLNPAVMDGVDMNSYDCGYLYEDIACRRQRFMRTQRFDMSALVQEFNVTTWRLHEDTMAKSLVVGTANHLFNSCKTK